MLCVLGQNQDQELMFLTSNFNYKLIKWKKKKTNKYILNLQNKQINKGRNQKRGKAILTPGPVLRAGREGK